MSESLSFISNVLSNQMRHMLLKHITDLSLSDGLKRLCSHTTVAARNNYLMCQQKGETSIYKTANHTEQMSNFTIN